MKVFDKNWHKLHLGVTNDEVKLYVDCKFVESMTLFPQGQLDANGEMLMGKKSSGDSVTVSVSLSLRSSICGFVCVRLFVCGSVCVQISLRLCSLCNLLSLLTVALSVCLCVRLSVYRLSLSVCLCVRLIVYWLSLSVCLCVRLVVYRLSLSQFVCVSV